ncbi:MAG: Panacea domain-containing protein [Patescibacteria group bacterium]
MVTMLSLKKGKYQNAILYLCQKLGGELRGKKKLAKLLYYVDFDLYEKSQRSLTGDVYKALPMGPYPTHLEGMVAEMQKKGVLEVSQSPGVDGYNPTEVYVCIKEPSLSVFDNEEKKMLDRVIQKYGHLTGTQLQHLSHTEAPYVGTELSHEIPYELAYYRGTNFAEA